MDFFQQLFNGNNDDDDDENINLPSFMGGCEDTNGLYNGVDSDTPICDSDDDDTFNGNGNGNGNGDGNGDGEDVDITGEGDDDPPINYEEYFNRFLNNGLGDELNLDNPDEEEEEEDNTNLDVVDDTKEEICHDCDCTDSCSVKIIYTREELEKMKYNEIRTIAKSKNISMKKNKNKKNKTKVNLINDILKKLNK